MFDYLTRTYFFAKNTAAAVVGKNPHSPLSGKDNPVEIFQLKKDLYMNHSVHRIDPEHSMKIDDIQKKLKPCTLAISIDSNREINYRVTLPDGKPSDTFTKNSVVNVVMKINAAGSEAKDYRPVVTGTDLSALQHKFFINYTTYSFYEKVRVELMIENAQKTLMK
jgi:hypothetical protein